MSSLLAGIDIGGTKCAVSLGQVEGDHINIVDKFRFPTPSTPQETQNLLVSHLQTLIAKQTLSAIGISCGGPLDSRKGLILSPPNLAGWDSIPIVQHFVEAFHVPVDLQNDANAGALAEWLWGAGQGCQNMIFLTFGTGMGAGLILNGKLYGGTNDMAGEVGHVRLAQDGPIGYGKFGSFEGFCSGGGIKQLATSYTQAAIRAGKSPDFAPTEADLTSITAEKVAASSDPLAREIFEIVARRLGQGLSILIDILNPERIVIGGIYMRQREILEPTMQAVLKQETLSYALSVCQILPAGLGEFIGDYAALAVARYQNTT
ncbi:MAG: ROK family protein [Anaerolineaceae bacterium]|nr:ROK family protein [Anaerolineaceae bacterium]